MSRISGCSNRTLPMITVATLAAICTHAGAATAQDPSGFSIVDTYPAMECVQPEIPLGDVTRAAILQLEADVELYRVCVSDYLDQARADMDALAEHTNGVVDSYNGFVGMLSDRFNLDGAQ